MRSEEDLRAVFEVADHVDIIERAARQRPDTQWKVRAVTNVPYIFYSIDNTGRIGCPLTSLLAHIARKTCLANLLCPSGGARTYDNNSCFFRCLGMMELCICPSNKCKCGPPLGEA